ncbi:hypothetical protein XPA_006865 [Xanthoria parietina]
MQEFDDRQWVSTIKLDQMLVQWADRLLQDHKDGGGEEKLATLEKLLSEYHEASRWIQTHPMELGYHSVMLSIAVLGERLMSVLAELRALLGLKDPRSNGSWRSKHLTMDLGQPIIDLLGNLGWCPYDVGRIDRETDTISVLYYYSNLKAPRSDTDHSSCSRNRCSSMTTDPALYKPKHRRGDCECQIMSADPDQVARILLRRSIPLVYLSIDPESGRSKAVVRPLMDQQTFVAISHVWAEGAGNPHENALQCCMVEDIEKCVRQLPWQEDEIGFPFWIDTLCVPVGPTELKTLALNQMRVPYERAEHVLVLDSHLRSLESSELSTAELLAQVSCSSWMRRLWTLQEARLAKRLWFQFADKAVDVIGVFRAHVWKEYPLPKGDIQVALYLYSQILYSVFAATNRARSFREVIFGLKMTYTSLQSRSVSVPTDEALCLFTLMGLDIAKVTAVPPLERMNVFWRTFNSVPASFFFSRAPRKLLEPGLRWAPSSLMQCESMWSWLGPPELSDPTEDDIHAVPTNEGLLAPLPGLLFRANIAERFEKMILAKGSVFIIQAEDGSWLRVSQEEPWNQGSVAAGTNLGFAIILAPRRVIYETTYHSHLLTNGLNSRATSDGVFVSRRRMENGIIHVTGLNHVKVELLGEGEQKLRSMIRASLRDTNISHDTFMALKTENNSSALVHFSLVGQGLMSNEELLGLLEAFARYVGESDAFEGLVKVLMELMAEDAFNRDCCCDVQELPESQQWCID